MKNILPVVFFLMIMSCNKTSKTYYPDGKIRMECPLDLYGKRNGIYKVFDKSGNVIVETEIKHDTLSGIVKNFYPSTHKPYIIVRYKEIYYPDSISPIFILAAISKYTDVETYVYNKLGAIEKYNLIQGGDRTALVVNFKNDSILNIWGTPNINQKSKTNEIETELSIGSIPYCKTNFFVLDSINNIIFQCKECKDLKVNLDTNQTYFLKVEYIDSIFKISHISTEAYRKKDFPKYHFQQQINWERR